MLVDKSGLWYRVLVSRYGESLGRVQTGGREVSSWWREIARIRNGTGDDEERGWFAEGVERRVGDGAETFFWSNPWLGCVPFCVRFRRLYDLSLHRSCTVAEMSELGWGEGGAAWAWRRQLWVWEEELLGEFRSVLANSVLQPDVIDR
ncbi:hypothetical protein QL285_041219 [Trifolium repens]|nr:hypothetical protein QL285_041219 [Trifolium repens]